MNLSRLFALAREEVLDQVVPGRKLRRELRARWGRPGPEEGAFLASGYFDLIRDRPGSNAAGAA